MQVRERIRINGKPISPELFTKHFWRLYHQLEEFKVLGLEGWDRAISPEWGLWGMWDYGGLAGVISLEWGGGAMEAVGLWPLTCSCVQDDSHVAMPAYFRFLTLMAFHVFLQEKVGVSLLDPVSESLGTGL